LALVADGDGVQAGAPVRVMLVTGLC
jgi:hypothetical protein